MKCLEIIKEFVNFDAVLEERYLTLEQDLGLVFNYLNNLDQI